jgi:hypothetical protein
MAELIPINERYSDLKGALRQWTDFVVQLKQRLEGFATQNYLMSILYAALTLKIDNDEVRELAEKSGLDRDAVATQLDAILKEDVHLRATCADDVTLLYYLDRFFISEMATLEASGGPAPFDNRYDGFIASTYSARFKRHCYLHLFNFSSPLPLLEFEGIHVLKLNPISVNQLLGQQTLTDFYHKTKVGEHFIHFINEAGNSGELTEWVDACWRCSFPFVQFLQYMKDALVHIDYWVPYFEPAWVNTIRKGDGVFYMGSPRRVPYEGGGKPYVIESGEVDNLRATWDGYRKSVMPALAAPRTAFRETIWRAGDFFEGSFSKEKAYERLLALAIALEALFSPDDNRELTFRICQTASQLVGREEEDRVKINKELKRLYKLRSNLVHASYKIDKFASEQFVTHEEIDRWSAIVRAAILRFIVLHQSGYNTNDGKKRLHDELLEAALNTKVGAELREKSDFRKFVADILGQGGLALG